MIAVSAPPQDTINDQWALAYADLAAKHALDRVGRKLAGRLGRSERHRNAPHRSLAPWNRHTAIQAEIELDKLLSDALVIVPDDVTCLRDAIDTYVRERVVTQQAHDTVALHQVITAYQCPPVPLHRSPGEG